MSKLDKPVSSARECSSIADDIYTRAPVNKSAALATGRGVSYSPQKIIQTNDSDYPIAIRQAVNSVGFTDLIGTRFGRFIVVGLARDFAGHWVVRCTCGRYSTRRKKAVLNPANNEDRCEHCRHLRYLQTCVRNKG